MLEMNRLHNMDCMEGMKQFPDKYIEFYREELRYCPRCDEPLVHINGGTNVFFYSCDHRFRVDVVDDEVWFAEIDEEEQERIMDDLREIFSERFKDVDVDEYFREMRG